MKELSLNILDIAKNSVKAGASYISVEITERSELLTIKITDNGKGMDGATIKSLADPFFTTRTTRPVGMGIPLFKLAAEQAGGGITIESRPASEYPDSHGTTITARFNKSSIDFTPLGDLAATMMTLIQGSPEIDFAFLRENETERAELKTAELREVLGDVPLDNPEVLIWIKDSLNEQLEKFPD